MSINKFPRYVKTSMIEVVTTFNNGAVEVQNLDTPTDRWIIDKHDFKSSYAYVDEIDIGKAVRLLKSGSRIARKGWNGAGLYLVYMAGYPEGVPANQATADAHDVPLGHTIVIDPYIAMRTASGSVVPWLASQTDLLATDYVVVG